MEWDAVGALAELMGAVAVLITVGYLAVQIRQNTRALKTSALSSLRDLHLLTENNDQYNVLITKSLGKEELTPDERILMVERFYTIMKGFEVLWLQQQVGSVSHDQFDQHLDLARWALSVPASRRMWTQLASVFSPGFQDIIASEVLSADAPRSQMLKAYAALDPEWVANRAADRLAKPTDYP